MSIIIRRATINDLETLHDIELECFTKESFSKQHIASLLKNPDSVSLVAQMGSVTAGYAIGLIRPHNEKMAGHIYTLDVAVKYRRRGVGAKLLGRIERIFSANRAEVCFLEARRDNVAALTLYRRHGYVKVEELKDYYEGAHGVRLAKRLRE